MVYKIIDEHGGTIKISSKEGEGTTVTIILPG
jgi:signal transduction histidine kinase